MSVDVLARNSLCRIGLRLIEHSNAGVFRCPEDDRNLDYGKIYPDQELQSEIMNSVIRCTHFKEGCRWVNKLHNLQNHLGSCRYDSTPCPNKCSARLSRLSLLHHLEFSCPKTQVKCEFCNQEFSRDYLEMQHVGDCPSEVVWCENKCGAKLERRFLANHSKNECHKRTVSCQYCSRDFVEETLQTHQYQCPRYPISCPNCCEPTKIPREDIDAHVQEICPTSMIQCSFKYAGCKHKCPRFNLDKHLDDNIKLHLSQMCNLVDKQQEQISNLCSALYSITQVTDGTFIWKITDYKQKFAESMYRKSVEITSEPFYTTRYGYKMAASVFLYGNGTGEGKYLSVYIKLIPGEYDAILEWPFLLPISFTIFDQCAEPDKRANYAESFIPDRTWKHFQKPCSDAESLGFGYPMFISQESLKTRDYIKNDTLILKVKIDNSKFIIP